MNPTLWLVFSVAAAFLGTGFDPNGFVLGVIAGTVGASLNEQVRLARKGGVA